MNTIKYIDFSTSIFQPFYGKYHLIALSYQDLYNPSAFSSPLKKTKAVLGYAVLLIASFALQESEPQKPLNILEKINITKTLKVATIESDFEKYDSYHGMQLDTAVRYAEHLGANITFHHYDNQSEALMAMNGDKVDIVLGKNAAANHLFLDCYGKHDAGFFIKNNELSADVKSYLCNSSTIENTNTIARFYNKNHLNYYSQMHFERTIKQRLPLYEYAFKKSAEKYGLDWQILAAVGYQESHLRPSAISPTGVQGIMMLTNDTAMAMGVADRTDPAQSIYGGAKYLARLGEQFAHINESERLWFVLASYNMGPNAVRAVQDELNKNGKNPNLWSNMYRYFVENSEKNSRYVQCTHYVTNIRSYLYLLKNKQNSDTLKAAA